MCKRYGYLPSEIIELDPYWIDFNTAVALKGQLEQNKEEEKALEDSKSTKPPDYSRKTREKKSHTDTHSQPKRKTVDDIIKERNTMRALQKESSKSTSAT